MHLARINVKMSAATAITITIAMAIVFSSDKLPSEDGTVLFITLIVKFVIEWLKDLGTIILGLSPKIPGVSLFLSKLSEISGIISFS